MERNHDRKGGGDGRIIHESYRQQKERWRRYLGFLELVLMDRFQGVKTLFHKKGLTLWSTHVLCIACLLMSDA
jgi:hypothetical protein